MTQSDEKISNIQKFLIQYASEPTKSAFISFFVGILRNLVDSGREISQSESQEFTSALAIDVSNHVEENEFDVSIHNILDANAKMLQTHDTTQVETEWSKIMEDRETEIAKLRDELEATKSELEEYRQIVKDQTLRKRDGFRRRGIREVSQEAVAQDATRLAIEFGLRKPK